MATPQPTSTRTTNIDTKKTIDDISKVKNNVLEATDEITNSLSKYADRLGKVFKDVQTYSSDINHLSKESIGLIEEGNAKWGNRNKLLKVQADVQKRIDIISGQITATEKNQLANQKILNKEYDKYRLQLKNSQKSSSDALINAIAAEAKLKELRDKPIKTTEEVEELITLNESLKKSYEDIEYHARLIAEAEGQIGDIVYNYSTPAHLELLRVQKEELENLEKTNIEYLEADTWLTKNEIHFNKIAKASKLISGIWTSTLVPAFNATKDYIFKIDSYSTDFAKNSGVSKEFAEEITKSYAAQAVYSKNALLTIQAQATAQQELQEAAGVKALYTQQDVQSQVYLTKQLGLEGDEAARLNQISLINNQATQESTDNVYAQVAGYKQTNGLLFDGRKILKEVANTNGVIAANYKNNPIQIAKAVVQARALGVSLQEAAQASRSLLDFESSIENELEAELLTGKAWNLEKARALELSGDSAGALKEELKNVGTLYDFQKLNVVAKEAEAKAVGMTVDQLSDALRKQEVLKTSTVETLKAQDEILAKVKGTSKEAEYRAMLNAANNGEELQKQEALVSKQMEFEASMERLKDNFSAILAGPVGGMIDGFTTLLKNATAMKLVLAAGASYMTVMAAKSVIEAIALVTGAEAVEIMTGNVAGAVAIGALAAGVLAYNSVPSTSVNDALIGPTGQVMISTPEGLIRPNRNDSIITTTDPGSLLGAGSNTGNSRIESLLAGILDRVGQPGVVQMDSQRVGTAMGINYSIYA